MKVLKIIFVSLVVVFILAGIGLMIFIRTFDLNKYKPQIVQAATQALGRNVEIGRLDFAFSADKGVAIAVHGMTISDDAAFSPEPFLKVESIKLGVDVARYLSEKQIVVTGMTVTSPVVQVIRDKAGILNVLSIGMKSSSEQNLSTSSGTSIAPASTGTPGSSFPALPPFLVKSISIDDGKITLVDNMLSPAVKLNVTNLDFHIDDFSLENAFPFTLACSVFSADQNIKIKGKQQIEINKLSVTLSDVQFSTDLQQIVLELVSQAFPQIKELQDIRSLQGKIAVNVPEFVVNPLGVAKLSATSELVQGKVDYRLLPQPLEDIYANIEVLKKDINVNKVTARYGNGQILAKARIEDYWQKQHYTASLSLDSLDIKQPIPDLGSEARFTGIVQGKSDISGEGFDPNTLISHLIGEGQLSVEKAKLENANLLRLLLNKLTMIPDVVSKIEANLPEKYKTQLDGKDTLFQSIEFAFKANNGIVDITKADLAADIFAAQASGSLDAQQNLTLNSSVEIPKDLSQSMVQSVPELGLLVGDSEKIIIPMKKYSGPATRVKIFPDLEFLGKRIIVNEGRQQIQKLLDKAIGGDKEDSGQQQNPDGTSTQTQGTSTKSPEQQLIEGVLDKILR